MPFPTQDPHWKEVADYIKAHAASGAALLAPDEFVELFGNVYSYAAPGIDPGLRYDWIIVHKGQFQRIDRVFLNSVMASAPAVVANDVFVVFANVPIDQPPLRKPVHLEALRDALRRSPPPDRQTSSCPPGRVRPVRFADLDVQGVRELMNERYSQDTNDEYSGYEHPLHWDRIRYHEVDRLIRKLLGDVSGLAVLEIGCGIGRNSAFFAGAASYLGTDLSDVAIAKAQRHQGNLPRARFMAMDAMDLALEGASFDLVLGVEFIEHVQDSDKLLKEVHRVLRPGGRFIFNSTNRDSLHLRAMRALDCPEVVSTHEHFREFGLEEMVAMLSRAGFDVEASEGVFLNPYLSIPGLDEQIRMRLLQDPAVVEALRELGSRSGPEFAFEFMLSARKR